MGSWGDVPIRVRVARREGNIGNGDCGPVLQLLETAVGDYISRLDSLNSSLPLVGPTRLDRTGHRFATLKQINEGCISVVLDGRGWDQHLVVKSCDQQTRIDELVREELTFRIIEARAQLDRACRGVDLVIDGGEFAHCDQLVLPPVV